MIYKPKKMLGKTSIPKLNATLEDFWSWAYSDILVNTTRGVFAEFLVGVALDAIDKPRTEWDAVDLEYRGKKIEVKSSAYLQSWPQNKLSDIVFSLGKKKSWDAKTNQYDPIEKRSSDCFVFCIYTRKDKNHVNVLDIDKWDFLVACTNDINNKFGDQKTVQLSTLKKFYSPIKFEELKETIVKIFNLGEN